MHLHRLTTHVVNVCATDEKVPRSMRRNVLLGLIPLAVSERCASSSLVLHCTSRCAGVNVTSFSSTNPPPEQVLAPPSAEVLAQLENEADGVRAKKDVSRGRRAFSLFAQLAEGTAPKDGSPSVPTTPGTANFSDQVAALYARLPNHPLLRPTPHVAHSVPSCAWTLMLGCLRGCCAPAPLPTVRRRRSRLRTVHFLRTS